MSNSEIPDFDLVEQLLNAGGTDWEAAESHGAFCGRACLSGAAAIPGWTADLFGAEGAEDVLQRERTTKMQALAASSLLAPS